MIHVKSKLKPGLGVVLTAALVCSLVLVAGAPASAAITGSECGSLEAGIGYGTAGTDMGEAEWTKTVEATTPHEGTYAAKITTDGVGLAAAKVAYGGTLDDLATIGGANMKFWAYLPDLAVISFAALWLDTNDDGVADVLLVNNRWDDAAGAQNAVEGAWVEVYPHEEPNSGWSAHNYDAATGGIVDIPADAKLAGGPYGCSPYQTLAEWALIKYVAAYDPEEGPFGGATVLCVGQMIGGAYGSQARTDFAYADDMTIGTKTYGMEPCYELVPDIAMNVKTADATFTVKDGCGGPIGESTTVGNWIVTKGEGAGVVTVVAGGADDFSHTNDFITVRMITTGDCIITCDVDYDGGGGKDVTLHAEKKWGEIDSTALTAWSDTPCKQRPTGATDTEISRANIAVDTEVLVQEKVIANFLPGLVPAPAGGAKVTWWLLENDEDDLAQTALEALLERFDSYSYVSGALGYGAGCGQYGNWAGDATFIPETIINGIYALYEADDTLFTKAECGDITDTTKTETYTDHFGDPLGEGFTNVTVKFSEVGTTTLAEPAIVVVLADYPLDKNGQNAVCVEYFKFTPGVPPAPAEVKTPQVRWAGEKIVLEKDCSNFATSGDAAVFTIEEGCDVGSLEAVDESPSTQNDARTVYTTVGDDGVARCILISEQQGEADVNLSCEGVNAGFLVYYLAFEDVSLAEDITPAASLTKALPGPCMDVDAAVQVRGWFTSWSLPGTAREAVDLDGDDVYELPAGRYVLPDDWDALAGYNYGLRPNWDLMDQADNDTINSIAELGPYDSEVKTTTPPGEADDPCIGPFNTLQPWSTDDIWTADDVVPADFTVAAPVTGLRTAADVRNTVVPDGSLDDYDCPMPQALVIFDVVAQVVIAPDTGTLSGLDKGDLEGYGYAVGVSGTATGGTTTTLIDTAQAWTAAEHIGKTVVIVKDCTTYEGIVTGNTATTLTFGTAVPPLATAVAAGDTYFFKVFQSPFYEVEIPSHELISSTGYNWDSWSVNGVGPYEYWSDLGLLSINGNTTEIPVDATDVEVYCDNHGIAGVTIVALSRMGSVTITATAEFPNSLTKGKYGPRTSDKITATWGAVTLNPHFEADISEVEVGETVTFTNLTAGGTLPYVTADWDWGDGTTHGTTAVNAGETITHTYNTPGVYDVMLTMTDSTPSTRSETQPDYITVTGEGEFDPMVYDTDEDGEISKSEALNAVVDYFDEDITKANALEVIALYFG